MTKNNFLNYLIVFIAVIAINFSINAQNTGKKNMKTPEEFAKFRADKINTIAGLSSDQYTQVYNVFYDLGQKRVQLKETYGTDKKSIRDAMKTNRQSAQEQIKTILTDDQEAKLKEHRKTMREQHKGKKFGKKNRQGDHQPNQ